MPERFTLAFAIRATRLGPLLVAATTAGVCFVRFGDDARARRAALAAEFPFADAEEDAPRVAPWCDALVDHVDGRASRVDVPLDVRGSTFQRHVWKELSAIPRGETRSYREIADAIGMPRGARAVARACARNPLPVAIPCHRVIGADGRAGGYNGGAERKLRLLAAEAGR